MNSEAGIRNIAGLLFVFTWPLRVQLILSLRVILATPFSPRKADEEHRDFRVGNQDFRRLL